MSTENNTVSSNQEYDLASIKVELSHAMDELLKLGAFIDAIKVIVEAEEDSERIGGTALILACESTKLCADIRNSIDLIELNIGANHE